MSDNEALQHDVRELEHLLTVATVENDRLREALVKIEARAKKFGFTGLVEIASAAIDNRLHKTIALAKEAAKKPRRRARVADDEIPF